MKYPACHVKGGDYEYDGHIVSIFKKTSGAVRLVVEDANGRLFVHNFNQVGCSDEAGMQSVIYFDPVADMAEFHGKFGLGYEGKPRALVGELLEFRSKFLSEELEEYNGHATKAEAEWLSEDHDHAEYTFHLEGMLDGLVDLVYIAIGNAHLHGFNFKEAWRRVHKANMQKVRRVSDGVEVEHQASGRLPNFDIVKPPGWEPPSHTDLVEVNDLTP